VNAPLAHAFARLAPRDGARLRALLNRPRRDKTDAEMREALDLITSVDALASAQATAHAKADEGRAALQAALVERTDAARRGPLVGWIDALVDRDA
jgi:geranylgeranyl pyrophosphate synthase